MKKQVSPPPERKKKAMDYRQFANKYFKDPTKHLPLVVGFNNKKYEAPKPVIKAQKLPKYKSEHECYCGSLEKRESVLKHIIQFIQKQSFVACPRCTNLMKLKRIEENTFVVFYIYYQCLLKNLKKRLEKFSKKTVLS